ncbi:MAG: lipid A phosphate methyltransferase [Flavobacteriales bacterium]|nr:lipid A phosphate methyltransferase [Flavobacteriales bacterium]|tara:strand:- start:103 stop:840 length:738 start_codon:yes stop_codon:yes gene_type:complete
MSLVNSWEEQGNFLFKYRGQFPVLLFLLAVPFLFLTDMVNDRDQIIWNSLSVFFSIIGFLIRFYTIGTTPKGTSGRNTKQQIADYLNSVGIYSTVRHPLYLGNYLIWIGIAIFTYNIYFIVIISLLFWLYYERIMFAEERFLEKKFGEEYVTWSNRIPAFIPSFKNYTKTSIPLSFKSILRREYAGILAAVIGFSFIDVVRIYVETNILNFTPVVLWVLLISLVLVFFLRSLKHYTNILTDKNRS